MIKTPGTIVVHTLLALTVSMGMLAGKTWTLENRLRVTLPETYRTGEPFDARIEILEGPAEPQKLEVRINYLKNDLRYGGGLESVVGNVEVEGPMVYEEPITITKEKPDLGLALVTVYLSPDRGWKNRTLQAVFPILPEGGDRKLYESQLGKAAGQKLAPKRTFEVYEERDEYFSQRTDEVGRRAWKMEEQSLPPLDSIINRPASETPVYGVYSWAEEFARAADEVEKIGFRTLRLSGPWSTAGEALDQAAQSGIEVMVTLKATGEPEAFKKKRRPYYDSDEALIADFQDNIRKFLAEFGTNGRYFADKPYDSPVKAIELWNEPNFHYLIPDGEDRASDEAAREKLYAKMIAAGFEAAREADPEMQVVAFAAGGSASGDIRFIEGIHEENEGIVERYDILSTHPYSMGAPPETQKYRSWGDYSIANNNAEIRRILKDAGQEDKPIWWTEIGWQFSGEHGGQFGDKKNRLDFIVTPDRHAAYVVRLYLWAMRLGVDRVHIMHLHDADGFNGGFLERSNLEWRPAAKAVAHLIDVMPNPKLKKSQADGEDGTYIYEFAADHQDPGKGDVIVVWNVEGPREVAVRVDGDAVLLYDLVGNQKTLPVMDGMVEVEAGPYPVYLMADD